MPYKHRIKPGIEMPGSVQTDTLLEFPMVFPSIDDFGSISGNIVPDSTRPDAKWVVLIMGTSKPTGRQTTTADVQEDDDDDGGSGGGGKGRGRGGSTSSKGGGGGSVTTKGSGSGDIILQRFTHVDFYQLYRMAAGKYKIKFILDEDENGYFTPGSLDPYRLPEKTAIDPSEIEVRIKWEVEGYNLFPSLNLETPDLEKSSKRG